jgi:ATP-dependent Lon protease
MHSILWLQGAIHTKPPLRRGADRRSIGDNAWWVVVETRRSVHQIKILTGSVPRGCPDRAGTGAKTKEGDCQVTQDTFPVLPLRDIVVFPHMIVPLFVGREKSVRALEEVMQDDKQILLSSQIDPAVDDPDSDGIYRTGVLANVLQLLKLPDGTVKVLVEGRRRVIIEDFLPNDSYFEARVGALEETPGDAASVRAMIGAVAEEFEKYAKVKKNIPEDALTSVAEAGDPAKLADLVSGHLGISVGQKQELWKRSMA